MKKVVNSIPANMPLVLIDGVINQAITQIFDDDTQETDYFPVAELNKPAAKEISPAPADPAPADQAPADPAPADQAPADPAPADQAPVDPAA